MFPKLPSRIAASCAAVALFASLASCSKKEEPTSTFTGKVLLYDERGTALTDNSGATVSLYEDASISTTTAVDGSFSLANAPLGPHRIKIEKCSAPICYGTYYTDVINTTAPLYALDRTIRIGRKSDAGYRIQYVFDRVNRQIVVNGTRDQPSNATDTRLLFHRVLFGFYMIHSGIGDPQSSKYSVLRQNNLLNGFSDTISYAQLASANVIAGDMAVSTDNPRADSCSTPFYTYNHDGVGTLVGFHRKSSPALGSTQEIMSYSTR